MLILSMKYFEHKRKVICARLVKSKVAWKTNIPGVQSFTMSRIDLLLKVDV